MAEKDQFGRTVKATKKVTVGVDIRDGSRTEREVPVEAPKKDWSEGRVLHVTTQRMEGSLNGRTFDLKTNEDVWLNADEFDLFKAYVKPKAA